MVVPRCVMLVIAGSVLSFALPAPAQERGRQSPAVANPPSARAVPRHVDERERRWNMAVANRMTGIPAFVQALRSGDANVAKRIFVAYGGSADQVILVPALGWNPATGYNASEPFPAQGPVNPVNCEIWYPVWWGWNIQTQSYSGVRYVCAGRDNSGNVNWVN